MTTENTAPALAAATLAHTTGRVTIPADMDPIVVLGVADQVLRALERGFPHVRFLVTGREISLAGTQADIDVAAGLLEAQEPRCTFARVFGEDVQRKPLENCSRYRL